MAALVSHAMRRYPLSPPDGVYSCNLRGENTSWSSVQEEGEGALSRSMRYADQWLYDSLRGGSPSALVLTPAFVLCSCPDYINGTKRGGKKKGPTVCKKCKGTRVSLSGNNDNKFGTVRCYSTSPSGTGLNSINATSQIRSGTVRATSSSRPTILSTEDPYNLMRRSRLNASSEATSPFRRRSISPTKTNHVPLKTSGRRSILECDINPYELMSTEADQQSRDNSITFVNGQRIRIRPQAPDPDYEDVDDNVNGKFISKVPHTEESPTAIDFAFKSSRPKPNRIAPDPPIILAFSTIETDANSSFKSILKKSSTSDDTIMYSPSPSRSKSGSHFYIPFPTTPRKKVQFLMENSETSTEDCRESLKTQPDYKGVESEEGSIDYSDVFEEEEKDGSRVCTLRRSTSERFKFEHQKVVFLDTMALRSKSPRGNSLDTFNNCDLEKLDGLVHKRKISPRPKDPPPLPPHKDIDAKGNKKEKKVITVGEPNKRTQNFSKQIAGEFDESISSYEDQELLPFILKKELTGQLRDSSSESDLSKSMKSTDSGHNNRKQDVSIHLGSENEVNLSTNVTEINKSGYISLNHNEYSAEENKPQAPPRKKSTNKQQYNNVQINQQNSSAERNDIEKTIFDQATVNKSIEKNVNHKVRRRNSKSKNINVQMLSKEIENIQNTNLNYNVMKNETEIEYDFSKTKSDALAFNLNRSDHIISSSILINDNQTKQKNDKNSNKTVVQVTPPSPVHRIQIKNEFPENSNVRMISILNSVPRKTSIMINGDDCYSTVNVNDDVPLYQSSVVVRDPVLIEPATNYSRRSSSVYIKGRFSDESSLNCNIFKVDNRFSINTNLLDVCTCKNSIETEVTKEEKINEGVRTEHIERDEIEGNSCCMRPSTPEMLRELLRDPVEAVKRNLVPHICGKSDVSRRPRDVKPKNNYPILSLREPVMENINSKDKLFDKTTSGTCNLKSHLDDDKDACSEHSSSTQYEFVDPGSDCYTDHSNISSVAEEELSNRTKFYELLADSALLEISENEDHHYECINKNDSDPIYEEIEIPPPLPSNPPPINLLDDLKLDKEFTTRSIFEGASKYDILSYLVDAKERGIVPEDSYTFSNISVDDMKEPSPKICHMGSVSDSSEDNSLVISGAHTDDKGLFSKSSEVERNDSGVGSETSKCSFSKYRSKPVTTALCEDCESALETLGENEPMLCRKCLKKRCERKEIIMEIVETEEKYSKDLQIILEEFYQPMLVAGLLTPDQLSTIFLNVEELLENSQSLAERLRDTVEIATEQGDEDLLTVNIGKLFLEAAPMLHAFETYCVRQGPASLLLASLEKEKELLRIFLRVSQMENTLLRRMNLNSFLMVPVQRVTKYPLLLARLFKVTPNHNEAREQLREAQHKIELHLNHMNSQTKDVPSKLWRRIGNSSGRRSSTEMDLVNIKLRKIAVDVLEWNHEEAKFALEGKLWFTQPTDNNWRKGRTIKLSPVNALLVINGKPTNTTKIEREDNSLIFPKHSPTREAALLLVRDKNGRYSLLRDPLYLDRCVIASDPAWQSYFEVQELLGKDTFIFKAEDEDQTKIWYQQLQFQAQGMGSWRKRRNALANIMMNGMGLRL